MFDVRFTQLSAQALGTDPSHLEKDWHVVRALGIIGAVEIEGVTPVFSGGTSLAAAWRVIKRFSEDIDFKVRIAAPSASAARTRRGKFRDAAIDALEKAGFALEGEVLIGNMSRFFRASFRYGAILPPAAGIRPHLQIEMTFGGTVLEPVQRPVQSLLSLAAKATPEVPSMLCVDPVETAADKISALAWRAAVRDRTAANDDPAIVRHIHDLAALAPTIGGSALFPKIARVILQADASRTKLPGADGLMLLRELVPTLRADPLWRHEYERFVQAVSFGPDAERITFDDALAACTLLTSRIIED